MRFLNILEVRLRQLFHALEVDKAVFFGVLAKIWSVAAGPLTALLIIIKFTPEYQGYYYTFGSLLALQVFVELGLGTVIIQFASHEWSKLRIDRDGGVAGDKEALSRLVSLAKISSKWFVAGGAITFLGLGSIGYIFFLKSQNGQVNWVFPWFSLCFFTAITVILIPLLSLLEGCNQVGAVYTYRFFQGIVGSLVMWAAIFSGAKLWSITISAAATTLCAVIFLKYRYGNFIKSLLFVRLSGPRMDWRKEILPMQWRIALSWVSGYFVYSFFTPVIFHYHGPVVAGQFGMTWSVVSLVAMIAGSWLPPKVPRFGMLIAEKNYGELDALFARIMRIFVIISAISAITVWLAVYSLNRASHPFAARLLPVLPTTIFLISQVISVLSLPFSAYLRAHKKEPLLAVSVCAGLLTVAVTLILGKYSVVAIGFGYLAINIIVFPFLFLIWQRYRQRWHV